ncbi:MAG: DNA primase [Verrucomicrobiota bacterium]
MPLFSPAFIERVRAASDIVDVVGASLPLKRAGTNFVALCPFHTEKSPSFNVSPSRQIFHCFGCKAGGDVFGFVQKYESLPFTEAVERLAERARIPIEYEGNPNASRDRGIKDQLLRLHEALAVRWQNCLANEAAGQVARDYLQRRGVAPDSTKEFRIGAAPEAWDDTVNWAKRNGFDLDLCKQAGVVVQKDGGNHCYDRFRGRLMFPICDEQGRVIAFSGRILEGDEKIAKYVNSPETPLFTKGRVLYALDKAKRAILDAGHAIICEGQLDTIACHAAGVRNAIAPQGTALTADHARILRRYAPGVILCFDGDKAGRNAAIRSLDQCMGSGLSLRVASIPPPDDPDSFLKARGAEPFRALLAKAQAFFDFYLEHLIAENDLRSDVGRLAVLNAMGEKLQLTGNAVLVDTYAQRTAQRLAVTVEAVRSEFRKIKAKEYRSPRASEGTPPTSAAPVPAREEAPLPIHDLRFVELLCRASHQEIDWLQHHLDPAWIAHATTRDITRAFLRHVSEDGAMAGILGALADNPHALRIVTEAAAQQRAIPDIPRQLADATRKIRDAWIDRQVILVGTRLGDPASDHESQIAALREQQELRALRKAALTPLSDA